MSLPAHLARSAAFGWDDRGYMPAPLAHATGLLIAIAIPAYTGCSVVLCDHWDAELAVDEIQRHGVTFSGGATVFIQELLTVLEARGIERLPMRSGYTCGGSTVPTAVAEAAEAAGLQACRSYGMTQGPCVSGPDRFDPQGIRLGTDGRGAPRCEIRVVAGGEGLPTW